MLLKPSKAATAIDKQIMQVNTDSNYSQLGLSNRAGQET